MPLTKSEVVPTLLSLGVLNPWFAIITRSNHERIASVTPANKVYGCYAMAARKAALASRVGAIAHVLEDGANGILLSSGDVRALHDLLKSEDFSTTLGQRTRGTVEERNSAAAMAKIYLQLYSGAAFGKRGRNNGI